MVVVVAHSSKCFSRDMVLNLIILFVMKYLYLGINFWKDLSIKYSIEK